jgi:hypothetical protein
MLRPLHTLSRAEPASTAMCTSRPVSYRRIDGQPPLSNSCSNKRDWGRERERNILSLTCVATYKGDGGFHTLLEHISPLYWFQEKEKWGILWRYYKENILLRFKAPHHKIEGTDRPISTLLLVRHHGPWSSARVASGLWWGDLKAWKL